MLSSILIFSVVSTLLAIPSSFIFISDILFFILGVKYVSFLYLLSLHYVLSFLYLPEHVKYIYNCCFNILVYWLSSHLFLALFLLIVFFSFDYGLCFLLLCRLVNFCLDTRNYGFYIVGCWVLFFFFFQLFLGFLLCAVMLVGISLILSKMLLNCAKTGPIQPLTWVSLTPLLRQGFSEDTMQSSHVLGDLLILSGRNTKYYQLSLQWLSQRFLSSDSFPTLSPYTCV